MVSCLIPVLSNIFDRWFLMVSFWKFVGLLSVLIILIRYSIFLMAITYLSASLFFLKRFCNCLHLSTNISSVTSYTFVAKALFILDFFLKPKMRIKNFFSFFNDSSLNFYRVDWMFMKNVNFFTMNLPFMSFKICSFKSYR